MIVFVGVLVLSIVLMVFGAFMFEHIAGALLGLVVLVLGMGVACYNQVDEGHAAVKVRFGVADDEAVGPGIHWAAPWVDFVEISTREQVISFEGDSPEAQARSLDDITMQTEGGGSFDLDARVRIAVPVSSAVEIYRNLGTGYVDAAVIPSSRECIRDASVNMGLTEAITSGRPQIADNSEDCLGSKLTDTYGIRVISVELGGTEVPAEVQNSINAKQGEEQARQAAEIGLETARIEAERQAVEAKGISDAEQIIACGATQVTDPDGNISIVPKEECEDQFSESYLRWVFLQNMGEVDSLTVLDSDIFGVDGAQPTFDVAPSN